MTFYAHRQTRQKPQPSGLRLDGACKGTPSIAVAPAGRADGVVLLGIPTGYGNYVKLAVSGREEQIYGHLSEIDVHVNDLVAAGQVLGTVGSTGSSTGPHLHFEVRANGIPVDPARLLQC